MWQATGECAETGFRRLHFAAGSYKTAIKKTALEREHWLPDSRGWLSLHRPFVKLVERGCRFPAHVALEDGGIGLAEIHDNQAVQAVGELAVNVKTKEFAPAPGVLWGE